MNLIKKYLTQIFLVLSAIGLTDALFLTQKYYSHDPFSCPIFGGCEAVTNSQYSQIFGIPLALLGASYYLAIFLLSLYSYLFNNKKFVNLAAKLTIAGLLTSIGLIYLQIFVLQAICFYCMVSAIVSILLFITALPLIKSYFNFFTSLKNHQKIWGLTRISLGWIYLWTFLDEVGGWASGTSPTKEFLELGTKGFFAENFQAISGSQIVEFMYMGGMLLVGITLILGITSRLATIGGVSMMLLIALAVSLPPEHNPLIDEHVLYTLVLLGLYYSESSKWLGFGNKWEKLSLTKKFPILK